jgi:hypothetical protein
LVALVEYERLDDEVLALAQRIREQSPRSVAGNRAILRAIELAVALPEELLAAHEAARREAYGQMAAMPTLVRQRPAE